MTKDNVTAYLSEARIIFKQVIRPMRESCAKLRKEYLEATAKLRADAEVSTLRYEELQEKILAFCVTEDITLDGDYKIEERKTKGARLGPPDLRQRLKDTKRYTEEQIEEIVALANLRTGGQSRRKLIIA